MSDDRSLYQRIPSVERVIASSAGQSLLKTHSREALVVGVRTELDRIRDRLKNGAPPSEADLEVESLADRVGLAISESSTSNFPNVVNATGVVLHTNLGRALLAESAIEAAVRVARDASALEFDVAGGVRGDRDSIVEEHLRALTGAEAATVVNNNAAAVLLVLNALAEGCEVVVSRGELIEIGGSFRIPDVLEKSGAILREVGTTNRTHPRDYESALSENTAMLLKVHTSNYRIVGFTAEVGVSELRAIADKADPDVAVVEDLGAGALVDLAAWGLPAEPVVAHRIAMGADVVTFSGDKLLGGPQCGIIVGSKSAIDKIRKNPLKRALRCDKMTLAALEETLRIYRFDPKPEGEIPTLALLLRSVEALEAMGQEAIQLMSKELGSEFLLNMEPSAAQVGSGSQPEVDVPSVAVTVTSKTKTCDQVAEHFRRADPPIIGRIESDRFWLDLRTVRRAEDLVPHS